jgi:hypothetical protein
MIQKCCTEPKPDYLKDLTNEEYRTFCHLVYLLRKRGYRVEEAQAEAYHRILAESILLHIGLL